MLGGQWLYGRVLAACWDDPKTRMVPGHQASFQGLSHLPGDPNSDRAKKLDHYITLRILAKNGQCRPPTGVCACLGLLGTPGTGWGRGVR
ncbi:hypothetical protein M569_17408 [Genlisea aurea]|uniref:Uncharacterized protein n=1 Tax=Genlisea aurea TaxID=192259 RepID=S8BS85_9LAMI|nr:hypothetical protein M569_17408 [Genlisea aurea]